MEVLEVTVLDVRALAIEMLEVLVRLEDVLVLLVEVQANVVLDVLVLDALVLDVEVLDKKALEILMLVMCPAGHVSWQGFQVGSEAMATADITFASEVILAMFAVQLTDDSQLQHLWCKYGIALTSLDRFFRRTIVCVDANWVVCPMLSMARSVGNHHQWESHRFQQNPQRKQYDVV